MGAVPQLPRHSTVERVKSPSSVVSPTLIPSLPSIKPIILSAPSIEQEMFLHTWIWYFPTGRSTLYIV